MTSRRRRTASTPPVRQVVVLVGFAVLAFVAPVREVVVDAGVSLAQKFGEHEARQVQRAADDAMRAAQERQAQRAASAAPAAPAGG